MRHYRSQSADVSWTAVRYWSSCSDTVPSPGWWWDLMRYVTCAILVHKIFRFLFFVCNSSRFRTQWTKCNSSSFRFRFRYENSSGADLSLYRVPFPFTLAYQQAAQSAELAVFCLSRLTFSRFCSFDCSRWNFTLVGAEVLGFCRSVLTAASYLLFCEDTPSVASHS